MLKIDKWRGYICSSVATATSCLTLTTNAGNFLELFPEEVEILWRLTMMMLLFEDEKTVMTIVVIMAEDGGIE